MDYKNVLLLALVTIAPWLTGLQAQTLFVNATTGAETSYSLSNIRKLSFTSDNLTITKTDNTTGIYLLTGLRNLSFSEIPTSLDISNDNEQQTLMLYPNPVINELSIDFTDKNNAKGTIRILSIEGREIISYKVDGSQVISLNLTQLPKGIYICQYLNGIEMKTVKFIKQ